MLTILNGDRIGFMHTKNEVNEKCMRLLTELSITEYLKNLDVNILLKFIIINHDMKKGTGLNCLRTAWDSVNMLIKIRIL